MGEKSPSIIIGLLLLMLFAGIMERGNRQEHMHKIHAHLHVIEMNLTGAVSEYPLPGQE